MLFDSGINGTNKVDCFYELKMSVLNVLTSILGADMQNIHLLAGMMPSDDYLSFVNNLNK